ncbi:MAG: hypothetical protein V4485_01520 [Pseudomonadota bacterium]
MNIGSYKKCLVEANQNIAKIAYALFPPLICTIKTSLNPANTLCKVVELIDTTLKALTNLASPEHAKIRAHCHEGDMALLAKIVNWRAGILKEFAHLSNPEEAKVELEEHTVVESSDATPVEPREMEAAGLSSDLD